ncbi:hypothetical protein RFI_10863 [Reticulomyxa filosa]|uniref:Uncharacterized protein n=1 Tax=Reticulomyxa filosa TaxID=46433 RepID=X6NK36_RETFI|nr:hypothetical protein RFI_10863 [Reticulomyxa filosa]|eukprot:ETO26273.1 hypothetical protein RFI_10863 [Reticulomyxa filosa]
MQKKKKKNNVYIYVYEYKFKKKKKKQVEIEKMEKEQEEQEEEEVVNDNEKELAENMMAEMGGTAAEANIQTRTKTQAQIQSRSQRPPQQQQMQSDKAIVMRQKQIKQLELENKKLQALLRNKAGNTNKNNPTAYTAGNGYPFLVNSSALRNLETQHKNQMQLKTKEIAQLKKQVFFSITIIIIKIRIQNQKIFLKKK